MSKRKVKARKAQEIKKEKERICKKRKKINCIVSSEER